MHCLYCYSFQMQKKIDVIYIQKFFQIFIFYLYLNFYAVYKTTTQALHCIVLYKAFLHTYCTLPPLWGVLCFIMIN